MKVKIAVILVLIFALASIYTVNNKIKPKNNTIKMPSKVKVKKWNGIKLSKMLDIVEKYKELKIEDIKYDNKDACINILINGNIQNINDIVSDLRQEKNLLKINQVTVVKNSQGECAKMQLVFKRYEEVN